jgi:hypothetical protein
MLTSNGPTAVTALEQISDGILAIRQMMNGEYISFKLK